MESYALVSRILGHASHSAHCKHLSASTKPVMFTHQTPEPCDRFDPRHVPPHLGARTTPDDSHCGRRSGSTPPPRAAARSVFSGDPGVGRCGPRQERGGDGEAAPSVYGPSAASPQLRLALRLGPLRPLSVTASRSGKMAAATAAAAAAALLVAEVGTPEAAEEAA